jgi:hypothetical protein
MEMIMSHANHTAHLSDILILVLLCNLRVIIHSHISLAFSYDTFYIYIYTLP